MLLRGEILNVTKEFLKSSNVPDDVYIPIYPEDYIHKSNNITQEKIDKIKFT